LSWPDHGGFVIEPKLVAVNVNGTVTVLGLYLILLIFCSSKVQINTQFLPHSFFVLRSE